MTVKIMIDSGHGGTDPGASANGLREKDLTLKIGLLTKKYLDDNYTGHLIKVSRSNDKTLSLKQRTDMANTWGADFFLSIHINAGGGTGYEDYIYVGLRSSSKTAKLQEVIHKEVTKAVNWRNRGRKKANFHVLRETKMPAMLTENGFIDTKKDSDLLKKESTLQSIAKAHAVGLAKAFHLKEKESKHKPKPSNKVFYRVVAGSFQDKTNALDQKKKLEKLGVKGVFLTTYKE